MRKFFLIFSIFSLLVSTVIYADDKPKKKNLKVSLIKLSQKVNEIKEDEEYAYVPAKNWKRIMSQVRESKLKRNQAVDSLRNYFDELYNYVKKRNQKVYRESEWVFPVRGYDNSAIGGVNGSGYVPADFDFFESNSGGHPAHDIFIKDANQDMLDDNTGKPVEILSMSGGIVIETRTNWTPDMMDIKGGNIVYVYDSYSNGLFYYAHLDKVFVEVGDFVKPGTTLGTMGRTGKNAYPKRSPTHLHIMYVICNNGELKPDNIYGDLLVAKTIK